MELIKYNSQLPAKLEDLTKFILFNEQKIKSMSAEITAMKKVDIEEWRIEQRTKEAQLLAEDLLDAKVAVGEYIGINVTAGNPIVTKGEQLPKGITRKKSHRYQKLAKNKKAVAKAKAESRKNDDVVTETLALRIIKAAEKDKRIIIEQKARGKQIADIDIRKGDFKKVLADVYDIDFILTDPPYPEEYLDCFSELSKYASEHLKKDGFVAVYSGKVHIPEVIKRLSEYLTYVWTFVLYHKGQTRLVKGFNIMTGWKPIFIFSRGRKKMFFPTSDIIVSEQMEKHSHEWQQSESGASQLIEIFSESGDLIVDPFSGSGTFLKVAKDMSRRSIGAEIK